MRAGAALRRLPSIALAILVGTSTPARAQERPRLGVDTIVVVDDFAHTATRREIGVGFDALVSVRLGGGFYAIVRPMARRLFDGRWTNQICQAALRYESSDGLPMRVEFGYLASPIGLGTLESRADDNPTIQAHPYYYEPMPSFELGAPRVQLISTVYPFGGQVSVSRPKWDLRAALLDSSATRIRRMISRTNPPAMPQVAVGGGLTPAPGVRLGASLMHGPYGRAREFRDQSTGDRTATVFGMEGEYAFRYTKINGEWVRDSFETAAAPIIANGWFVQGVQTLTPRWFAAGRTVGVSTVRQTAFGGRQPVSLRIVETVVGFRVTPEITLRTGHLARRSYGLRTWDHQFGMSVVWARRWM